MTIPTAATQTRVSKFSTPAKRCLASSESSYVSSEYIQKMSNEKSYFIKDIYVHVSENVSVKKYST